MRDFRLILSCDDWAHIDYLPLCASAWRKFFPEFKISVIVLSRSRDTKYTFYWDKYAKFVDTIHVVHGIDGIAGAPLAKMARMWISGQFGKDVVTLNDIDLVPLQRGFYEKVYSFYQDGKFLILGENVYDASEGKGRRAPMSAFTGESWKVQDLVNPRNLSFEDFVKEYALSGDETTDNRTDVLNAPYFSDEIVLQDKIEKYGRDMFNKESVHVDRLYNMYRDTVDRACWNLLSIPKLRSGGYLEGHLLKYYRENLVNCDKLHDEWGDIPGLWPIIEYIGYDEPLLEEHV